MRRFVEHLIFTICVLQGALFLCASAEGQVKTWEGTLTLPTYEEGLPDPNPPFDTYATTRFNYPYTLRTNLTGVKADHAWRAVFLENEYLKCTVLPDIGGHLYTCLDKISGQSMFYANPSIKKAQIGYRGAWAAFGMEYNFPVSHNWVSMSPVDFAKGIRSDGSAWVTVGNIDRVYGMQWSVELVLKPGSTLLEERVRLYNRSDVRHRYYWWNNAGIEVWNDSKIEYPMQFAASHGYTDVYRWPTDATNVGGKDLSLIENQIEGPVSMFVHGSREPFMGIWNPKTKTGVAHYAEYKELPAKKIWSWGVDKAGLDWRTALSDNQSAYVEVQAGLFRNQETYAFLEPGEVIQFSEYWMPVRGTGGISRANKAGIVQFNRRDEEVSVALNVNERMRGAQLSLMQGKTIVWSGTLDLIPEKTWSHVVTLKDMGKLTFEWKDGAGRSMLRQTEGKYDWDAIETIQTGPQKGRTMAGADARTEDDWLQKGMDEELNGKTVQAMASYEEGLKRYSKSLSLQVANGRMAAILQRYSEAASLLRAAQARNTPDAEVAYYLGIAEEGLGRLREAEVAYGVAYRQSSYRGRAAMKLGELKARHGALSEARAFLHDAVLRDPLDIRSLEQLEAVQRAMGDTTGADESARRGLVNDPLSDYLHEEIGKPNNKHLAADPYRVLRVSDAYMKLGLYERALAVLTRNYPSVPQDESEPGALLPQRHPLVLYYTAYCKAKLGRGVPGDWAYAASQSTDFVFAASAMDEVVLEAALTADDRDATAHWLLGTLLFSKGQYDDGIAHWTRAKELRPQMKVVNAVLGKALLQVRGDVPRALAAFREGLGSDAENAEVYLGLDAAMSINGSAASERAMALEKYPGADAKESKMPATLVYQLGLTRAEAGEYEAAESLFRDRFFPSEEGGISATQVLSEIRLMHADADALAGRCDRAGEVVKTLQPATAREYFKIGRVLMECKQTMEAKVVWQKITIDTHAWDLVWAQRAQRQLGSYDEVQATEQLTKSLATDGPLAEPGEHTGLWWAHVAMLQLELGQKNDAERSIDQALLLPDIKMSHHFARMVREDAGAHVQ